MTSNELLLLLVRRELGIRDKDEAPAIDALIKEFIERGYLYQKDLVAIVKNHLGVK